MTGDTLTYNEIDLLTITKTRTKDKKEKSPRFAFLKISASTHLAHLQSRTSQLATHSFAKEPNLPPLKELWTKTKYAIDYPNKVDKFAQYANYYG